MKVLVVYDSFFGNTKKVAEVAGNSLYFAEPESDVEVLPVTEVQPDQLSGVDLLLVGSPTRGFRPSPGTTAFLKRLAPSQLKGIRAAAFDTRINVEDTHSAFLKWLIKLFGYAAPIIEKQLVLKGAEVAGPAEGFAVGDSEGPLKNGELYRVKEWAESLV